MVDSVTHRFRLLQFIAILALGSIGCKSEAARTAAALPIAGNADAQVACERALNASAPHPVATLPPPEEAWTISAPEEIGAIAGLDVDRGARRMVLFDYMNAHITELTMDGHVVRSFGQEGQGPGDLEVNPMLGGLRTNRLVLMGDSAVAVADMRYVKLFDRQGTLRRQWLMDTTSASSPFDLSLARLNDSVLLSPYSGRWHGPRSDMASRTLLQLLQLPAGTGRANPSPYLRLRNNLAVFDSLHVGSSDLPYRNAYGRSWGAAPHQLDFISWRIFGVCSAAPDGTIRALGRPAVDRYPVDAEERERVLKEDFGGGHTRLPMIGKTGTELYEGHWPALGPVYLDLVVAHDSSGAIWATRRDNTGRQIVDVYGKDGYVGSFERAFTGRVAVLFGDEAVVVDGRNLRITGYRWRALFHQ